MLNNINDRIDQSQGAIELIVHMDTYGLFHANLVQVVRCSNGDTNEVLDGHGTGTSLKYALERLDQSLQIDQPGS